MNAISLAAGKLSDAFLLVGAGKIETRNIGTRIHLSLTEHYDIEAVGNFFPDGFVGMKRIAGLIDVTELDGRAHLESSGVGFVLFGDQSK